jgi:hypothetical protein
MYTPIHTQTHHWQLPAQERQSQEEEGQEEEGKKQGA